ncbi:acyltransferase domain-containing protein [Streptomyces sp. SCSIO-PteL053]|nr:acyltransferase domain-containing protein [Streptomyces sp. SCSIO-PteL053]
MIGHSQGEIAAAVVAGLLSLEDGARVVALRSQALLALSVVVAWFRVSLPVVEVRERLTVWAGRVSVAAVNGPSSVVVSGEPGALEELVASWAGEGVRVKRIAVDYASHSAQVELIEEELAGLLAGVVPVRGRVPFIRRSPVRCWMTRWVWMVVTVSESAFGGGVRGGGAGCGW